MRPLYVVDAFTDTPFAGNPAAVVLCGAGHPWDEPWMQHVAAEMRHSETAFVRERDDGDHDLRWFTPEVEVDLCGHATLAAAHALWEHAQLDGATFHTRGGTLRASRAPGGEIALDFPLAVPEPAPPIPALFDAIGVEPAEFLRTTGDFFVCVVDDPVTVRDLAPDFAALRRVTEVRGFYVTAADGGDHDIVARCFAPRIGIDEDPVTGSMYCVLMGHWGPRLGRDTLRARQLSARGGELTVTRAGDRVVLAGRAVTIVRGELLA